MTPYSAAVVDPYAELGVPRDASHQAIKQAYRRIALATHPDHNSKDPTSAERFRRASQSYALLRDPERRSAFDRTGRWDDTGWSPAELDVRLAEAIEIFARDFGAAVDLAVTDDWSPAHTGRVTMSVDVSYEEVERGGRRRIPAPCAQCAGSGAQAGSTLVRCTSCGGSGRLRQVESSFLGPRIHTESCESCHGSGRRPLLACASCAGSGHAPGAAAIDVLIPRGAADGDLLDSLSANGSRFVARLVDDQRWARDGADLYATARMPYDVAVLGGAIDVELPGRVHRVEVPAGTASGHRLRVQGHGLPLRDGSGRGNLILTLHVAVPGHITAVERWLLRSRRTRSTGVTRRGVVAWLSHSAAWARETAAAQWRLWRTNHHKSSLLRIEKAAAALRSVAGRLSLSEQRLGPLLESGFPMIAPEAAQARRRLDLSVASLRNSAVAALLVGIALVTAIGAGLWIGAGYAESAINLAGVHGWDFIRHVHPAFFALIPLLAGLGTGAVAVLSAPPLLRHFLQLALRAAVAAAAVATVAVSYVAAISVAPEENFIIVAWLSGLLAIAIGITPVILYMQGDSLVDKTRMALEESRDRADRRMLRKYDVAAARLATQLEGTERAFRQLLTQADDARHPLTSLLSSAADTLGVESQRRFRTTAAHAVLGLTSMVAVTAAWIAATSLAGVSAFALYPDAATWARIATVIATLTLCAIGSVLPARLLDHYRSHDFTTVIATAMAVVALVAMPTMGPDYGWLAAGGAVAALALSFRLPDALRATRTALLIVLAGMVALVLWPFALAGTLRGGEAG